MQVTIDDQATPALQEAIDKLDGPGLVQLYQDVAPDAHRAVVEYYAQYGEEGRWENPSLPTHGAGRKSSRFAEQVAASWAVGDVSEDGINIVSTGQIGPDDQEKSILAHKVRGGTIRPSRVDWLTIPNVPEAHGIRARDYPARTERGLFFVELKENELAMLAERAEKGGDLRAVYWLKKEITQLPWDGALPPGDEIASKVAEAMIDALELD